MGTTACSSGTPAAPGTPSDHDVQGEWARDYGGPLHPGISFVLSLTESGGRVGGTGGYTVEAGAPGTIVVSGSVAHDSLRLTMVLTSDPAPPPGAAQDTEQFIGALVSRDRIEGTLTRNDFATALALTRVAASSP